MSTLSERPTFVTTTIPLSSAQQRLQDVKGPTHQERAANTKNEPTHLSAMDGNSACFFEPPESFFLPPAPRAACWTLNCS